MRTRLSLRFTTEPERHVALALALVKSLPQISAQEADEVGRALLVGHRLELELAHRTCAPGVEVVVNTCAVLDKTCVGVELSPKPLIVVLLQCCAGVPVGGQVANDV